MSSKTISRRSHKLWLERSDDILEETLVKKKETKTENISLKNTFNDLLNVLRQQKNENGTQRFDSFLQRRIMIDEKKNKRRQRERRIAKRIEIDMNNIKCNTNGLQKYSGMDAKDKEYMEWINYVLPNMEAKHKEYQTENSEIQNIIKDLLNVLRRQKNGNETQRFESLLHLYDTKKIMMDEKKKKRRQRETRIAKIIEIDMNNFLTVCRYIYYFFFSFLKQ